MAQGTFFAEIHQELDAKTVPCGKWNLPLFYPGGSAAEHRHTLSDASLFDQTGTGIFQLTGKDIAGQLDELFLYPSAELPVGGCMENFLLHDNGTFAARFMLCRMKEDDFMLLAERGVAEKDIAYLTGAVGKKAEVRELSDAMAVLTVTGKRCRELLAAAGAEELPESGRWQMITVQDDEGDELRAIAIAHDRFGLPAFDLCFNGATALEFYGALYRIHGISSAGTAAWESLRIESAEPGIPGELYDGVIPPEWGINVDLTRSFAGRDALAKTVPARKLAVIGFDRFAPLPGSVVTLAEGQAAGVITGGAFCPGTGDARAFAYLDIDCPAAVGTRFFSVINGKNAAGTLLAVKEL